jgi:hypothetical protein
LQPQNNTILIMDIIRSRRSAHLQSAAVAASRTLALIKAVPYGYSNTFHTRAGDSLPPTYNDVRLEQAREQQGEVEQVSLPPYTCTLSKTESVDMLCEFEDPFKDMYMDTRWKALTLVLQGTKLSFYSARKPDKLVHEFSLQHAEVGLAVDLRHGPPLPRSPLLELLPANLRSKLYETKPHLFEPVRYWCLRMRLEGRQVLVSFPSESDLLDWVEIICAAIDISPPIEERSLPKYRSLPRRSRRQRQLETSVNEDPATMQNDVEALTRQLIRQQQRILDSLYPELGTASNESESQTSATATAGMAPLSTQSTRAPAPTSGFDRQPTNQHDPDMDDLDRDDVMDYSTRPTTEAQARFDFNRSTPSFTYDPKRAAHDSTSDRFRGNSLRYRRRCAPIMNKFSPWSSDVIFIGGQRLKIDRKRGRFVSFELGPPKYSTLVKTGVVSPAFAAMGVTATTAKDDSNSSTSESSSIAITPTIASTNPSDDQEGTITPVRRQVSGQSTDVLKRAVVRVVDIEEGYALEQSTSATS